MFVDIKGKVITITGGSRGIGAAMAVRFAREGARVVLNYFKSEDRAHALCDEIRSFGGECITIQADVRLQGDVQRLLNAAKNNYEHIDVLVNNAGICADNYLPMLLETQWKDVLSVNLDGVYHCSRFFSKEMIRRRKGKIINIASIKGQLGSEGQTNYAASKAGVIGFTKSLAKELGQYGISVNAVCPGFIRSSMNERSESKQEIAEKMMWLKKAAEPMEALLDFMVFMISDNFSTASGRVYNLDSRL